MKIGKYLLMFLLCFGVVGCNDSNKKEDVVNNDEKNETKTYEDIFHILYDNDVLWATETMSKGNMLQFRFHDDEVKSSYNYVYFRVICYDDGEIRDVSFQDVTNKVDGNVYLSEEEVKQLKEKYTDSKYYETNEDVIKAAEEFLSRFDLDIEDIKVVSKEYYLTKMKDK